MKTTKKQTAVEWYNKKIEVFELWAETNQITWNEYHKQKNKIIQQAKEIEKQQIIDADLNGSVRTAKAIDYRITQLRIKELAEQNYNETYEI